MGINCYCFSELQSTLTICLPCVAIQLSTLDLATKASLSLSKLK